MPARSMQTPLTSGGVGRSLGRTSSPWVDLNGWSHPVSRAVDAGSHLGGGKCSRPGLSLAGRPGAHYGREEVAHEARFRAPPCSTQPARPHFNHASCTICLPFVGDRCSGVVGRGGAGAVLATVAHPGRPRPRRLLTGGENTRSGPHCDGGTVWKGPSPTSTTTPRSKACPHRPRYYHGPAWGAFDNCLAHQATHDPLTHLPKLGHRQRPAGHAPERGRRVTAHGGGRSSRHRRVQAGQRLLGPRRRRRAAAGGRSARNGTGLRTRPRRRDEFRGDLREPRWRGGRERIREGPPRTGRRQALRVLVGIVDRRKSCRRRRDHTTLIGCADAAMYEA